MPSSRIEIRQDWTQDQKRLLIDALHNALVSALGIPTNDKLIRIIEHQPSDFAIPDSASDNYVLVEITLFSGRSLDAKRTLYRQIVNNFQALGINPLDTRIILHEVTPENWGLRGGQVGSEIKLDYKVEV